jgi:hypothetical protein
MKPTRFKPGEVVPENGVYRAEHRSYRAEPRSHRLVHAVTLPARSLFPCCKECGNGVTFYFVRWVRPQNVLPLRSGILQEYVQPNTVDFPLKQSKPERGKMG